jgi:cell division transport system permease protein
MQLVGATRSFIRRPFLLRSALHGLIAALISMTLLFGLLYLVEKEFFMLFTFQSTNMLLLLGAAIIFTGILINVISTFFSVNRYLTISEDKLYYL